MTAHNKDLVDTSRRNFTKAMVTAAVATPIAASMTGCKKEVTGPTIKSCDSSLGIEEHIPPLEIDGSGSLRIEVSNKLKAARSSPPYYTYDEDGISDPHDRYGELVAVRVIAELYPNPPIAPYVTDTTYLGLAGLGCQLLLWYVSVTPSHDPGPDVFPDADFPTNVTFPDGQPHVRIVGGVSGTFNYFNITIKHKHDLGPRPEKTHKLGRPYRYRHEGDPNNAELGRHFRIGKWRIVRNDGVTIVAPGFEHSGALDYHIYATFGDYHAT